MVDHGPYIDLLLWIARPGAARCCGLRVRDRPDIVDRGSGIAPLQKFLVDRGTGAARGCGSRLTDIANVGAALK